MGSFYLPADNHGRQKFFQRRPRRFRPLVGIERAFAARAFAPTFGAVWAKDAHEDDPAFGGAPKTRLEKMN